MFIALGRLEEDQFGTDVAGIVTCVGDVFTDINEGDRVCMAALGCMRLYPRNRKWFKKIPDSVGFEEATALVNPGLTAYYSLIDVARLERGDRSFAIQLNLSCSMPPRQPPHLL